MIVSHMDKKQSKIIVNIFGQSYTLIGDANHDYMLRIAKFVDMKMKEVSKTTAGLDQLKIAILAAVNISNELFQLRETTSEWEKVVQEKSQSLMNILDKSIDE